VRPWGLCISRRGCRVNPHLGRDRWRP
jgi:hypothetical protein